MARTYTALSGSSPSTTTGTTPVAALSGLCNTNFSCRLALIKSLNARMSMNQPMIMSANANQSLAAIPRRPDAELLALPADDDITFAAAAAAAAEAGVSGMPVSGLKEWELGCWGTVSPIGSEPSRVDDEDESAACKLAATSAGDGGGEEEDDDGVRMVKPYCMRVMPSPARDPCLAA